MKHSVLAAGAALGNTEVELPRKRSDKRLRRLRYVRRKKSSKFLIGHIVEKTGSLEVKDFPLAAKCGWTVSSSTDVRVNRSADGQRATFAGVQTCSSVWCCPTCAAVIRAQRAEEISQAVEAWQKRGGTIVFLTLTVRHKRTDALKTGLDALIKGFQRSLNRRAWRDIKSDLGIAGFVRSVEVTYGVNGWHPHIHALLFLEGEVSADQVSRIEGFYAQNWGKIVESLGGRMPDQVHGFDVQVVDKGGKVLSAYLGKLQDEGKKKANVSAEIARFDIKTGLGSSIVPFELLDDDCVYADQAYFLWNEFVSSTRGRRAITWSKGMRDLAQLEEEKTDEELLEEDEEFSTTEFYIPNDVYRKLLKTDVLPTVLDLVEDGHISLAMGLCQGYRLDE